MAVSQILYFMAQLFDLVLPNLESFRLDPALLNETPIAPGDFAKYLGRCRCTACCTPPSSCCSV